MLKHRYVSNCIDFYLTSIISLLWSVCQRGQETWLPYFQFQSHEPEFDFLKSLEIESKINQIKFCHPTGSNNFILSANGKFEK